MVQKFRAAIFSFLLLGAVLGAHPAAAQCVSLTTLGSASTQSFNTLSSTAGSTTNNLTLTGWFMTEGGGGARDNEQYAVDTGGSNTGDTYSYGAAGNAERALGALRSGTLVPLFGACFTNNTGSTLTSLDVAYTGEQWRLGTTARTDQINFEYSLNATDLTTGTWTGVAALNFVSPDTGTTGPKDGNNAANRTARAATIPALSIANGATFWIHWTDTDASGADDGLAVDDFSLTPQGGGPPPLPTLNINDVALAEGDPPGTTTFTFTVSLNAPAGPGGVTFDIATADNTATTADNDYVTQALAGQTIPAGSSTYAFNVTVNRDTTVEPNQTFFVNVTSITGANAGDTQGTGTINNDDVSITPIHDIQGPGASSPIVGASVTTRGIVTGVRSNGFFIQEPDATVDADPATSEGILIFTNAAPPAAAVVGNQVLVTGTVVEFVPSQDPLQPPLTELSSPTVTLLSSGNPLPAPIPLTATFPDPAGPHDQLERLEGMRVSVASLTVVGPTLGNINEANASATSSGVFFGVVTGVARPFREPGIQAPDPAPAGSIPPIPRFDSNPERIRVDSDGQTGGAVLDVGTGAVVTGVVGPLDYTFRTYTILPDPASPPAVAGGPTPMAVPVPSGSEITVAAYNLQRFYDTVNDPESDSVLTAAAFDKRLDKASLAIRDYLRMPDILGVVEVENLTTLQALAAAISADAIAASQPDPQYDAYLVEGNDIGGIDVGFLVKTAEVSAGVPRVSVVEVVQENAGELFVNPDSSTELLNDRPSLRLNAVVNDAGGASFPLTVINNHLRSLNDSDSTDPGSNGWPTDGHRVRAKRQAQAESLADLVQARQTADPAERIVLVGDFNAFEFNDGFGDSMGVIEGTPSPDNETAVTGDGADLVNPDLVNLAGTAPAPERYSFVFDGNAQSLDHVVVNGALVSATSARRVEHPRVNADFPEVARNDGTNAVRVADHDPVVAFFQVNAFGSADLVMSKTDGTDPVAAGTNLVYTITLTNNGPDDATAITWTDTLPAGTTFVSLASPGGWTCSAPAVGGTGTVSCSAALLADTAMASFDLTVAVDASVAAGTVLSNTAQVTALAESDPTPADATATATTTVAASSGYSITMTDAPDPVVTGQNLTYTITVTNAGPSLAANVSFDDTLPAGTTFQSLSAPGGWSCSMPAVGAGGTVSCSIPSLGVTSATFTLTVQATAPGGTVLSNTAEVTSDSTDTSPGDNISTVTTSVISPAAVTATKTASGEAFPGGTVTYTVVLTNNAATPQGNNPGNEFTDVLPAELTLVSASATSGTAAVDLPTNTVTWNGSIAAGASVTITIQATVENVPVGTTISNQGTVSFDADGNGTNESTGGTDDPAVSGAANPTSFVVTAEAIIEVPVLDHLGLLLLVLMMAGAGALLARRF